MACHRSTMQRQRRRLVQIDCRIAACHSGWVPLERRAAHVSAPVALTGSAPLPTPRNALWRYAGAWGLGGEVKRSRVGLVWPRRGLMSIPPLRHPWRGSMLASLAACRPPLCPWLGSPRPGSTHRGQTAGFVSVVAVAACVVGLGFSATRPGCDSRPFCVQRAHARLIPFLSLLRPNPRMPMEQLRGMPAAWPPTASIIKCG